MPKNLSELENAARAVVHAADFVQVDVMDGVFVPEISWPFPRVERELMPFKNEEYGLPAWENLNYEFDLMIRNPEKFVETFVTMGAMRLIFHYESAPPEKLHEAIQKTKDLLTETAIAINPDTPNDVLDEFLDGDQPVDFVQFMGIAKIGYQGEAFDERVIPKISALRKKYPDIIISVDGGVNKESVPKLIAAGATRLAAGSAVFAGGNPREAIHELENLK